MKVLIDTSIWSLALRRKKEKLNDLEINIVKELTELIQETRAIMIGPIRQEILSGINSKSQYLNLKLHLRAFNDFPICLKDYEKAAEFFNFCRSKGVQGSQVDFIICSVAYNSNLVIFTTDNDFKFYAEQINIKLHQTRDS
ncbi:MAG: PIN domain-containing protein [Candidatus Cloacimonetes bacterium]|nr:PIN domain-containing protein [Candidatus Cloacimonadota bacterium]